ncbi:MAG TPA: response regulator [Gemmatimonadaceae bacterium]
MATVLYVDDEPAIRRAVVQWLSRRGHMVYAVGSLADAREVLVAQPVDGVFVDLWLGKESGCELQSWIEQHRPELSANVVYVTGDITACEASESPFGTLARPVLSKPFELRQLDDVVDRWMKQPSR